MQRVAFIKQFLHKYALWLVVFIAIATSITATVYYFNQGQTLAYNDARSHLDIARRVIDNKTPGIAQFGGTWLPLPQFLMLPFIGIDSLWQNGLAGAIISMGAFVLSAILIYKIILLLTNKTWASVLGAFVFMFNPNILYMQSTPMTELVLIVTMLFGTYFFIKWLYTQQTTALITAGFGVFLSTLVRYEGWFVLAICALIIVFNSILTKNYKNGEGQSILFSTLGVLGIVLWTIWNLLIFGNPIYFLNGDASAKAQQDQLAAAGQLPTKYHLGTSLETTFQTILMNAGTIITVAALIGLLYILIKRYRDKKIIFALIILLAPVLLDFTTLVLGISTVRTSLADTFNIRYGVMALPFISVVLAVAISLVKLPQLAKIPVTALIVTAGLTASCVTLYDPVHGSSGMSPSQIAFRKAITANYKGGDILASVKTFDPIMQDLGIPFKNYYHEGNYLIWEATLAKPQGKVSYMLIQKGATDAGLDPVYKNYLKHKRTFDKYFQVAYDKDKYMLLVTRNQVKKSAIQTYE